MSKTEWLDDLVVGGLVGLIATSATAVSDRLLSPMVSEEQKCKELKVREGSAHEMAGPLMARRLLGHRPSRFQERIAKAAFFAFYSLMWGTIYSRARRRWPSLRRRKGLLFAVPFFLSCDGGIAPLLKLTPNLHRIPWQLNLKELSNHIVWTATAEELLQRREVG